ncbi:MAG: alpha/beta hydrolase domain-containing protein [Bauldia sp.]
MRTGSTAARTAPARKTGSRLRRRALLGVSVAALAASLGGAALAEPALPVVENGGAPVPATADNPLHEGIFYTAIRPYLLPAPEIFTEAAHGYVTEEYFISGTANEAPYLTRILVHRPADVADWSGMTLLETMHPAGAAQTWDHSRVGGMIAGHVYVEVVNAPNLVNNLRNLNETRYADLAIEGAPAGGGGGGPPAENVAANQIIAQVAYLLKTANPAGADWNAEWLVITGSSATSSTAMNFMEQPNGNSNANHRMPDGSSVIDAMYVWDTNGPTAEELDEFYAGLPVVIKSTQHEWDDATAETAAGWLDDFDPTADNAGLYRLYQVAGEPHLGSRDAFAADPLSCEFQPMSHFFDAAMVYMPLEHLYNYLADDVLPPTADRIVVDANGLVFDEFGNATGGVRSPQLEVPTHTFVIPNAGSAQCGLGSYTIPLTAEQLGALYASPEDYAEKLRASAAALVEAGWFPDEYLFVIDEEIARYGQPTTYGYRNPDVPPPAPPAPAPG